MVTVLFWGYTWQTNCRIWPSGKYAQKSVTEFSSYGRTVQTEEFEGDVSMSGLLGFDAVLFSALMLEHTATFFRVQGMVPHQTSESNLLLILHCRKWKQHVSLKCLYPLWSLHGVKTKYIRLRTVPIMKTPKNSCRYRKFFIVQNGCILKFCKVIQCCLIELWLCFKNLTFHSANCMWLPCVQTHQWSQNHIYYSEH